MTVYCVLDRCAHSSHFFSLSLSFSFTFSVYFHSLLSMSSIVVRFLFAEVVVFFQLYEVQVNASTKTLLARYAAIRGTWTT